MLELSTGFAVFCSLVVAFCALLVWWVLRLANYCREAVAVVLNQNKNSVSLRRIAELEATLTELLDSYDALLESHKKLRSRIGMREVRAKRQNGVDSDATPANDADRASYKSKLRAKLQAEGRLR